MEVTRCSLPFHRCERMNRGGRLTAPRLCSWIFGSDSSWKIYLLSPSGGSPEALTQSNTNEADATWAPDGKSIVFGKTDKIDIFSNANAAIYRLDLKTGKVSSIPGSDGLFSPRASPDGRYGQRNFYRRCIH